MSEEIKNEAVAEVTEEPDYVIHKLSESDHPEANQEVFFHLKKGGEELKGVFKRFSEVHLNGAHFLVNGVRFYMHEVDTWHE